MKSTKRKEIKAEYSLMITAPSDMSDKVLQYLLSNIKSVISNPYELWKHLREKMFYLFRVLFPFTTHFDTFCKCTEMRLVMTITRAVMLSNPKAKGRWVYDIDFTLTLNDEIIPQQDVEHIFEGFCEDLYDGYYLGIESGQYRARIIEI